MPNRRQFFSSAFAVAAASMLPRRRAWSRDAPRFPDDPFTLGVASGYPTEGSVVLWTRLAPTPAAPGGGMTPSVVPVQWELAADERMRTTVGSGTSYASPDWAHSVHVEVDGLAAGREYWYRFTCGNARSIVGRTRTAAGVGTPLGRLKLAVASCQHYEHGFYTAYRHMLADDLDLIVHVGDYIYELSYGANLVRRQGAQEAYTLDDYRALHALYKTDPDLMAAHAAYPWLLIWDDHDVDNDYSGAYSEEDDDPEWFLARRACAYRAYYEHMPLPRRAVPFGSSMRLYAQRSFGDLATLYLLDQRQYRSPEACPPLGRRGGNRVSDCAELDAPDRTMLGARQEAWAFAQLAASRTRWNLIAQGTLMAHLNEAAGPKPRYWTDAWNGYPVARARLIDFLAERQIRNPVVLSGDIHAFVVSGINRVASDLGTPVVAAEFCGTSVSSHALPQEIFDGWRALNPNLLLARSDCRGYLRLDLTRDQLRTDLIAMDSVLEPHAPRHTLASFTVENGKPVPVRS
jgi:alkaline phosphatase D